MRTTGQTPWPWHQPVVFVSKGCEGPTLKEVTKVPDGQVDGQELLVVCAVAPLGLPQLVAEEGYRLSAPIHVLLQGSTLSEASVTRLSGVPCLEWVSMVALARAALDS